MTTRNFRVHNGISCGDIVINASNNTITVEFDQDGRDIYDFLEDAGLGHLSDEVIYTNYYADCL